MKAGKFQSRTPVLLAVLLALVVLMMAWPRMAASVRYRPVDLALDQYYASREIPTDRLLTLIGFAHAAFDSHGHYRYLEGLSLLHYLRALDPNTPALERRGAYEASAASAAGALERAPARSETWLRLATARAVLREEPSDVIAAWKMSVFTGRTHSALLVPRTGLGLLYANEADGEARAMLRDQLLLAWSVKPRELLNELRARDRELAVTRTLIGDFSPDTLEAMEARLETLR